MRLVDLLLVLLFEGREFLPKLGSANSSAITSETRPSDSTRDRSHRQLVDCIRSKDTDALIDAVENGKFRNHCISIYDSFRLSFSLIFFYFL